MRAQPAIALRDLTANGSSSNDDQSAWQAIVLEYLLVSQVGQFVEPCDGRDARLGTRVDQKCACGDLLFAHLNRVCVHKACRAHQHLHALRAAPPAW